MILCHSIHDTSYWKGLHWKDQRSLALYYVLSCLLHSSSAEERIKYILVLIKIKPLTHTVILHDA